MPAESWAEGTFGEETKIEDVCGRSERVVWDGGRVMGQQEGRG